MLLYDAILYANNILFESFKNDLFAAYNKSGVAVEQNHKVLTAIQIFNGNNLIKDKVKQDLKNPPNIAQALVKSFPDPQDLVNYINNVQQEFVEKEQQNKEKKQRKEQAAVVSEDLFVYPCHTFKEAHSAAFSHTGSLKRLSNSQIKNKYGIDVPEPARFYKTDKSPAEFLEFMKTAPFFMNPSWCVAANEDYWDEYDLSTEKKESPKCYIIISKQYPNVRFCITLEKKNELGKINSDSVTQVEIPTIEEFRDPWQIGGGDSTAEIGKEMADFAFGKSKVIENITAGITTTTKFKDIVYGNSLFRKCTDLTSWTIDLPKLLIGECMFDGSSLTSFSADLPSLTDGYEMFSGCTNLSSFNSDLSKLDDANCMFYNCLKLTSFSAGLPILTAGHGMFTNCTSLTSFSEDLPNLDNGNFMFYKCEALTSFSADLPKLDLGSNMFTDCKLDSKSVLHILNSIPTHTNGKHPLHLGKTTNYKNSTEIASLLGTTTPIPAGEYSYKGWAVEVTD